MRSFPAHLKIFYEKTLKNGNNEPTKMKYNNEDFFINNLNFNTYENYM